MAAETRGEPFGDARADVVERVDAAEASMSKTVGEPAGSGRP